MIIIRYLVREIFKSQFAILFILLLIFFCQQLVKILSGAVDGNIPTDLVLTLLGLSVPEMANIILPLSLFLAILMALGRLYTESEIIVMHACGLSRAVLVKAAMVLIFFTSLMAIINVIWLVPWASRHQSEVIENAKTNPGAVALAAGQFKSSPDGNLVLFIENVKNETFSKVFLAQLRPNGSARPSVVMADSGYIELFHDGSQVITLNKGARYEGTALLRDFRITDFKNYQAVIGYKSIPFDPNNAGQVSLFHLLASDNVEFRSELNWRLTLILSVLIMALIAVPLSVVNPRQGRVLSMLPALLLYFIFFLLQSSLRSNGAKGRLDSTFWMWLVNISYLALALWLNFWDTLPMRRLRARFVRGRWE